MKEIEVLAKSQEEAVDNVASQLRVPAEGFEVTKTSPTKDPEGEDAVLVRLSFKKGYLSDFTRDIVSGLLELMDIPGDVRVNREKDILNVDIRSRRSSILIGRRGETLDALQHILNRMISRNEREMPLIMVDVENYRSRGNRRLKRMAMKAAEKVQKTGKPIKLDPMSSSDRKFIHKLLGNMKNIKTYSMGREGQRRVIVDLLKPLPSKQPSSPNPGDEAILPELMGGVKPMKKESSPLYNGGLKRTAPPRPVENTDDMGELLDPDILNDF